MASTRNLYLNTGVSSAATSAGMKTILWAVPRATELATIKWFNLIIERVL